ncbi:MAG: type II toxin-antitoxin system RelE/ParE family toxin [Sterolibacterium sp.]|nr:type II toxin-antitoxin system RelE/ParE family toxin [Sterolibacterium sp.]
MNRIEWNPKALRQMRKLEKADHTAIRKAVNEELSDLDQARNVKALTNHDYQYRLRVGRFRVFFNFDGGIKVVSIEEVKKRDERTY